MPDARAPAIILLASPDALASPERPAEVRKTEDFGKEIIVVLMRDVVFNGHRCSPAPTRSLSK